jgi:Carboxypeptidase regulatory-like domain
MRIGHGRGRVGWSAAVRAWMCVVAALGIAPALWAQSGTDGAIGGRVVDAGGAPLRGATVVVRDVETGLEMHALSGGSGEFLIVRLPVGDYGVTAEFAGEKTTLPEAVSVGLGDVTEIELRIQASAGQQSPVGVGGRAERVTAAEVAELPLNGGDPRTLAEAVAGGNDAGGADGDASEVSFRGEDAAQNSTRLDGASGDEGFNGGHVGAGVVEEGDAGADVVYDGAAGVGSGARSVADGGQRAGSSYAFSQAGVREFRVQGQSGAAGYGAALYGHGVGGVVTAVSRSGGTTLHGMAFYTLRDSAWAAVNPFSVASTYAGGVVTSALVKPADVRQQFGGRVGGPMFRDRGAGVDAQGKRTLFYFYAFDEQRRDFPAISAPGYAGFYSLTAMQSALLANRE